MNHFLNSSFIVPNNDINIITIATKHTIIPKIVIRYFPFKFPKCIKIGPIKIGINEITKSFK